MILYEASGWTRRWCFNAQALKAAAPAPRRSAPPPRDATPMYFPNTFHRSSRIDRRKQRVNTRHKIGFRIRVIYLFLFQFHDNFKRDSVAN